jgi:alpha-L-rhamnosidase
MTLRYYVRCAAVLGLVVASSMLPANAAVAAAAPELSAGELQVDNTTNPLGIDDTHPSLGWKLHSTVNGAYWWRPARPG